MNPQKPTVDAGTTLAQSQARNKSMQALSRNSIVALFSSQFLPVALTIVAILTATPSRSAASVGPMDGGGGGAYVCRKNGKAQSAELIDLWEARNRPYKWNNKPTVYTLTIPYSDEPVDLQLTRALDKLKVDPAFYGRVIANVKLIRDPKNIESLPVTISIAVPPDALNVFYKTGCPAEGMMYFDDFANRLSVKKEIFERLLNKTNIAAAITHEAIYKTVRDIAGHGIGSSETVRRLNACLYAKEDCLNANAQIQIPASARAYRCQSQNYDLTVVQNPPTKFTDPNPYGPYRSVYGASGTVWSLYFHRVVGIQLPAPIRGELVLATWPNGIKSAGAYNEGSVVVDLIGHLYSLISFDYSPNPNIEGESLRSILISSGTYMVAGIPVPEETVPCQTIP